MSGAHVAFCMLNDCTAHPKISARTISEAFATHEGNLIDEVALSSSATENGPVFMQTSGLTMRKFLSQICVRTETKNPINDNTDLHR